MVADIQLYIMYNTFCELQFICFTELVGKFFYIVKNTVFCTLEIMTEKNVFQNGIEALTQVDGIQFQVLKISV